MLRIPAATRPIPSSGIGTTAVSLRYRIEMVGKDLGTLSQTLLRKLLERSFLRTFKNFKQGDFCPFLFCFADFTVAIFRATISGCSRAKSRPAGFCRRQLVASPRSRYRIEMVQVTFDYYLRWFIRILYNFLRSLSIGNRKISSANRSSHK